MRVKFLKNIGIVVRDRRIIGIYSKKDFERLPFDDWPDFSKEYLKRWVQSLLCRNGYLMYENSKLLNSVKK